MFRRTQRYARCDISRSVIAVIILNIIPIHMQVLKKVLNFQWVIVTVLFVLLDTFYPTVNQGIVRYLNVNRENV